LWIEADFNLPFVSYGGGNLVINMMSLALILSIYRRKDIIIIQNINENNKMANNNN
jgi:cell division protein FtsW (lipid II flippase)